MKNRILFLFFLFIAFNIPLFALGKKDDTVKKTQNDEWTLCITNINAESLHPERRIITEVILTELTERINTISYRTRISPEYTYYEEFAWASARSAAAKALAAKMEERSRLLFLGDPGWRYRQNIKKIDNDLIKLKENLETIESNAPLINNYPVFKLTSGNLNNTFPAAPDKGAESRFCTSQKADAFLTGEVTDFYGRFLYNVKLYTIYTRSFVWEDSVIFSHDDLDIALEEITRRLIIVLSGNEPAAVSITAEPEETLILINRTFAGRGRVEINEIPPGKITVTATAHDHESINIETELNPNELVSLNFKLTPNRYVDLDISGDKQGRIYQGALFAGDSPLTLSLPADQLEFIEFEARNSDKGTIVFQTPQLSDVVQNVTVRSRALPPRGRVDKERRAYYWAWGGTWLTGIAAWIVYHSYNESNKAVQYAGSNRDFFNTNQTLYNVSIGAMIAVGTVAAYSIYRAVRYLYTSNLPATSVATPSRLSSRNGFNPIEEIIEEDEIQNSEDDEVVLEK
ncbi:MAG: hypothetical protein FWB86_05245 [Treponema sp.]|nr:hypothetical protein [Treponema sp.]